MTPTGIIFDLDGTILDSMGMWMNAGELYLNSLGIAPEENLGQKLIEMNMEEGACYLKEKYLPSMTTEQINRDIINFLKEYYAYKIMTKPGISELLNRLKEMNIPMAIATNTDRELFMPCLTRLNLTSYFKDIFTCSETGSSKSEPKIYFQAAQALNSPVESTWVFEDAPYALKTAKTAGFTTIGIYDQFTAQSTSLAQIIHFSTHYCQSYQDALKLF